jgi:hypothetical protein
LRIKIIMSLLLAIVASMLAAGCGGGDDSDSATAGPITASSLSKAEYVKQVNAICVKNREERLEAVEDYVVEPAKGSQKTLEEVSVAIQETFPAGMEKQLAEMRELGAPSGDEKQIEEIVKAFERAAEDASENAEIRTGDTTFDKSFSHAGVLAKKYGIEECSVG